MVAPPATTGGATVSPPAISREDTVSPLENPGPGFRSSTALTASSTVLVIGSATTSGWNTYPFPAIKPDARLRRSVLIKPSSSSRLIARFTVRSESPDSRASVFWNGKAYQRPVSSSQDELSANRSSTNRSELDRFIGSNTCRLAHVNMSVATTGPPLVLLASRTLVLGGPAALFRLLALGQRPELVKQVELSVDHHDSLCPVPTAPSSARASINTSERSSRSFASRRRPVLSLNPNSRPRSAPLVSTPFAAR